MKFQHNDGGRAAAGYKGSAGDCVVRAVAIASGLPYEKVYSDLAAANASDPKRKKAKGVRSARNGVARRVYHPYLLALGFRWVACMGIGTGCKVHLRDGELPAGRLVARCSRHLAAVIDGVLHDTYDDSRDGTRCVYGYYLLG